MKHEQHTWKSGDGLTFFGQNWQPESAPRAVVALVHGMGEHSSRYAHLADAVCQQGIALMAFDLRGHGSTEGNRGHSPSYNVLMDDIDLFLQQVKSPRGVEIPWRCGVLHWACCALF